MSADIPGFDILYEEGPCLVVCKPAGLLTQAPPGIDSLETRVKRFLKQRDSIEGSVYLGVPHRLDRPVSGILVLAPGMKKAARRLSEQFEARSVKKTYWALVAGKIEPEQGTWTDFMRKKPQQAMSEIVEETAQDAQQAVLHYRVLQTRENRTLLEIELETGRTHQIRLQAASRGHAILGDDLYGSDISFGPQPEDPRSRHIALHARSLEFEHPTMRKRIVEQAPLSPWWELKNYSP